MKPICGWRNWRWRRASEADIEIIDAVHVDGASEVPDLVVVSGPRSHLEIDKLWAGYWGANEDPYAPQATQPPALVLCYLETLTPRNLVSLFP
jgi:hypothetical protein